MHQLILKPSDWRLVRQKGAQALNMAPVTDGLPGGGEVEVMHPAQEQQGEVVDRAHLLVEHSLPGLDSVDNLGIEPFRVILQAEGHCLVFGSWAGQVGNQNGVDIQLIRVAQQPDGKIETSWQPVRDVQPIVPVDRLQNQAPVRRIEIAQDRLSTKSPEPEQAVVDRASIIEGPVVAVLGKTPYVVQQSRHPNQMFKPW